MTDQRDELWKMAVETAREVHRPLATLPLDHFDHCSYVPIIYAALCDAVDAADKQRALMPLPEMLRTSYREGVRDERARHEPLREACRRLGAMTDPRISVEYGEVFDEISEALAADEEKT